MFIHEIDPRYILADPPDLTREIAVARWREINILLHSIALLGDDLDARKPLLPLLRASAAIVAADSGLLYQWDEHRSGLKLTTSFGIAGQLPEALDTENAQAHACLLERKPVLVWEPEEQFLRQELALLGARSALSVPITHQGMPWGALQLLRGRPFLKDEAILLWIFALILEGVLPSFLGAKRHRELVAPIDPATGLVTPDHFRRRLAWELQRSSWVARPVTVACIEVTELLHGRPRGGSIPFTPREAAQLVQKVLRQHDSITCLGGHHFIATLPDTAKPAALEVVDLIREAFLTRAAGTLPVFDIASGFASFPEDGRSEAEIIRAACASSRRSSGKTSRTPLAG
ncbi:MAG TPA: GAF domain-containing protein [Candidatus Polarisedimenticolia bacterium]|nr:GAF domain-containing protein [Candidatus Polarisedimenticolia bacterium]